MFIDSQALHEHTISYKKHLETLERLLSKNIDLKWKIEEYYYEPPQRIRERK